MDLGPSPSPSPLSLTPLGSPPSLPLQHRQALPLRPGMRTGHHHNGRKGWTKATGRTA
uniref:Uncharacterized protein n=1 Tax=Anguilla anguilla TaxID=7936 RepID=A0A0E9W373_ANGAN